MNYTLLPQPRRQAPTPQPRFGPVEASALALCAVALLAVVVVARQHLDSDPESAAIWAVPGLSGLLSIAAAIRQAIRRPSLANGLASVLVSVVLIPVVLVSAVLVALCAGVITLHLG